ncbi:protein unzipped [Cylas formicarius]|uniref:protein unzipped n=1 Tax=Cylas formicarius TaxID=197179 RepID=UPI0029589FE2|nr:protein unzipped [Cylas formicarius]XP_060516607.1 protein unzipped [Cylas formicarius]
MTPYHPIRLVSLLTILGVSFIGADPRVHILSENLDQVITSTTLQWVQTDGKDKSVLKNAVIAAYQVMPDADPSENSYDENLENDVVNKQEPVYVCRATVTSIWVSGQLRPKNHVCVVSLYRKVQEYKHFEVLVNVEDSGRLSWVGKNKYTNLPAGAVTSGENILRTFVSRKPVNSNNKTGSLSHYIGTFNPSENLGVFHLVEQNNNEISYEDGEILVETEPIAYEFRNIKFLRSSRRFPKKKRVLAHAILKNEEDGLQRVESVMSYNYTYSLNWGKGHGIQVGLPYTVFLPNGSQILGKWGILEKEEKVETVPVEMHLDEGTAVNVTLTGNYTEMEIPYTATVVSLYKDNEKREITIRDIKRENKVIELVYNYSPIYFLHNNSYVPTTPAPTTTSTTTTSTTTTVRPTSTTLKELPEVAPEVILQRKQEELHAAEKKPEDGAMMSDEHTVREASLESKTEISAKDSASAAAIVLHLLLPMAVMVLSVT